MIKVEICKNLIAIFTLMNVFKLVKVFNLKSYDYLSSIFLVNTENYIHSKFSPHNFKTF